MIRYIGIDPGATGGVAILFGDTVLAYPLGKDATLAEIIREAVEAAEHNGDKIVAALEAVNAFPGQGVSSSFKFGMSYGIAQGVLEALQVPYKFVRPQDWQKGIPGLPKKKDGATAHKRALREEASRRFPGANATSSTADALLIADWARVNWGA